VFQKLDLTAKVENMNFSSVVRKNGLDNQLLESEEFDIQEYQGEIQDDSQEISQKSIQEKCETPSLEGQDGEENSPQILRVQKYLHELEKELDLITPSPSSLALSLSEKELKELTGDEDEERLTDDLSDDEFLVVLPFHCLPLSLSLSLSPFSSSGLTCADE
jgi:hypothetical protein